MSFSLIGILSVILEVIRPYLLLILLFVLAEGVLVALALRKGNRTDCSLAFKRAVGVGVGAFILLLILVPILTGASHSNLASVIDYVALLSVSIAGAVIATFVAWPLLHLIAKPRTGSAI